jgi:hypothetical protein
MSDLNQAPAPLHPLLEGYGAAFMAMGTQPRHKFKIIAGGRRMLAPKTPRPTTATLTSITGEKPWSS